jgi:hypothetical protein
MNKVVFPDGKIVKLMSRQPAPVKPDPAPARPRAPKPLPPAFSLRPKAPPILDQLSIGSCGPTALCDAMRFLCGKPLSVLFSYYLTRAREGYITEDVGCELVNAVGAAMDKGVCLDRLWPYIDDGRRFKTRPASACYKNALNVRILDKACLAGDGEAYKRALFNNKLPVIAGIGIWESLLDDDNLAKGYFPVPKKGERILGLHYLQVYGYDDSKRLYLLKNSWGTGYGDQGWFHCPYEYLTYKYLNFEAWLVRRVG